MIKLLIVCNVVLLGITFLLMQTYLDLKQIHLGAAKQGDEEVLNIQKYAKFNSYLVTFNKSYNGHEYFIRLHNFRESLEEIANLNALEGGEEVFGLTIYADMSREEFARIMSYRHRPYSTVPVCHARHADCIEAKRIQNESCSSKDDLKYDWREKGYVTPVLDQKLCAGCWAFSIVGVMETMAAKVNLGYDKLSVQQLIDCSTHTQHCNGGDVGDALHDLCSGHKAITTEDKYPLTLINEQCTTPDNKQGRSISSYVVNCNMNEVQMLDMIRCHGPLIAIVNGSRLRFYINGIIYKSCNRSTDGDSFDHAIQIVGYDLTGSIPYYIVRNSMGVNFGLDGYVKIAIGYDVCGIREEVAYLDVQ